MLKLTTLTLTVGALAMSIGTATAADKPAALNFTMKSLGGKDVVARFSPRTTPDAPEVVKVIEAELAKK